MFTAALCVIPKMWKPNVHHQVNGLKKTEVYPHNRMLLSNKKKWTIDACNNMHGSQINYAEWKKPGKNRIHTVGFQCQKNSRKSNLQWPKKQISDCLWMRGPGGMGGRIIEGKEEIYGAQGYTYYLYYECFTEIYRHKNLSNCTL